MKTPNPQENKHLKGCHPQSSSPSRAESNVKRKIYK